MQNVIVLGGSYGGTRAAHLLAQSLPARYRVILIDRNTHANHLYVIPRLGVLPGHEHKAFIPYTNTFKSRPSSPSSSSSSSPSSSPSPAESESESRHIVLHAHITKLEAHAVTLDRAFPALGLAARPHVLPFAYAVYALGSHLPAPIDLWAPHPDLHVNAVDMQLVGSESSAVEREERGEKERTAYSGTKKEGVDWLRRCQERIQAAGSVLVVGGGALGIQFATDIASLYPTKQVTLLHSRPRLLPRFDYAMHTEVMKAMDDLRVDVILGERLDLASTAPEAVKFNARGQRVVRTLAGREVAADLLLLCTGQVPNTALLGALSPGLVDPASGLAHVLPTMQLGVIPAPPSPAPSSVPSPPHSAFPLSATSSESLDESLGSLSLSEDDAQSDIESNASDADKEETEEEDEESEAPLAPTPYPHIFVVGDAADAFGAIKAGHAAYYQAEVAARNIIALATRDAGGLEGGAGEREPAVGQEPVAALERYTPGPPAIKVSLGIGCQSVYQIGGAIGRKDAPDADDLDAGLAWAFFGMDGVREEEMYV